MQDSNKKLELTDEELDKITGGIASVSGWSSYKGNCECGQVFEVSNKKTNTKSFTCSCGRTYELIDCDVYCNGVVLPSTSYQITDHD